MPKNKSTEIQDPRAQETDGATQAATADEANFLNAPVVPLAKFNPYHRPAATREPDTTPIRQSYEDVQREAKGPGADQWRAMDKARANLSELYRNLQEDERYAEEYKAGRAWQQYEETKAKVEQLAPEARSKMLRSAESLERMSIPHPEGESLSTKDTEKLLLTAHERTRLEGMLNRAERQAKGPIKRDPMDILRSEFERGLDEGGPGGGATVRAIYQLCRDYGYDINRVVGGRRREVHHGALEDADRARMRANMVGRSVPEPPFPHPRHSQSRDVGTYRPGQRAFIGRGGASTGEAQRKPGASRRRRPWK
jgi:hypothetical protein